MLKKIEYKGKEYVQVDTINGAPILLKENYINIYNVAGIDIDGSPLRIEGKTILNTEDRLVGYYGADVL